MPLSATRQRNQAAIFGLAAPISTLTLILVFVFLFARPTTGDTREVLRVVADIPLPGPAVRFDYQSLNSAAARLYIAHMNADQLVVFDTRKREVVSNLDGFHRVHGVLAVPELREDFCFANGRSPSRCR